MKPRLISKPIMALAILIGTCVLLVYLPTLNLGFVNWDDNEYVYENPRILVLNSGFIQWAFSTFQIGNWHPMTWLSLGLDRFLWGTGPMGFHATNIVLHGLNTALVTIVVFLLIAAAKKVSPREGSERGLSDRGVMMAAAVTGILFGFHPIHVESVAWISERKDVLCAFFFLAGIATYLKYVEERYAEHVGIPFFRGHSSRFYFLTLGLFALALLSKPMAVTFPVVLLLLDWYCFNRISSLITFRSALSEKLPFFALCLISSILTIRAQIAVKALTSLATMPLSIRALVAAEALGAYLGKMILPMHLVPFYPYPTSGSLLPFQYLSAIALVLGISAVCAALVKKSKLWLTVWGCYVVTLLPVLGIVQVGSQSMADRYTYLPSIGPFLLLSLGVAWISERISAFQKWRLLVNLFTATVAIGMSISLIYLTVGQIAIWKDSITLWNYVIKNYPDRMIPFAYSSRGVAFEQLGQNERSIEDFDKAIAINPSFGKIYMNRGNVFKKIGQYDRAMTDYDRAIALDPSVFEAYNNRGLLFYIKGQHDRAIAEFDRAIALNPSSFEVYNNRGLIFYVKGQNDRAINDFDQAIALNPLDDIAYLTRGLIYEDLSQPSKAIANYAKTISLKPSSHEAYYHLGVLYAEAGSFERAIEFANKAIVINPNNARYYGDRGVIYDRLGQREKALDDFNKAIALDQKEAAAYFNRGTIYLRAGKRNSSNLDFRTACDLGMKEGCDKIGKKQFNEPSAKVVK
jgi:tetratricopeptide (TPR) repeat protein